MYVFRNHTVENLFEEGVRFSGYADVSDIPLADAYIWFYQVPMVLKPEQAEAEIAGIGARLDLVGDRIPSSKPFYIFSLETLLPLRFCDTDHRVAKAMEAVNRQAEAMAERMPNIRLVDFGEFLSQHSPDSWVNWKFYFLSQMVMSPVLAPAFKKWWADRLASLTHARKKCLVLDLDNTLWGGVLGEDGMSGVKMSGDYPGNAFMNFQEGLVALAEAGVILTVCSKNNEADVRELWQKNPFLKLGPKYISAYRINWNNKADNIRELSTELNIGLDSMVFLDDSPTERELVRRLLPMVEVPDFPKRPYELMGFFSDMVEKYFRVYRLTEEDRQKTEQYRANVQRTQARQRFSDLTDFIRNLEIDIEVCRADEFNLPRIAQMTQKTNQFNLTTRRYTEADLAGKMERGDGVYAISVKDKFGDNGLTGVMTVAYEGQTAVIDGFLLSCRILGKGIEDVFLAYMLTRFYENGLKTVKAYYYPTAKNGQVADFYDRHGFRRVGVEQAADTAAVADGTVADSLTGACGTIYELDLNAPAAVADYYHIVNKL